MILSKTLRTFFSSVPNHYDLLRVPMNASPKEVQSAFRSLAKKYHPDINKTKQAEEMFKSLNLAY